MKRKEKILKDFYNLGVQIEKCGASEDLTIASTMYCDLMDDVKAFINDIDSVCSECQMADGCGYPDIFCSDLRVITYHHNGVDYKLKVKDGDCLETCLLSQHGIDVDKG